ncbi:MAG TPA: trypsin-like peptidase domain-containing protein, partial [Candidatus Limnocylindria bacterium]|nr:trypsin-like peptidase domain-containing protein [Candidatus Limnocylindria bacterium]
LSPRCVRSLLFATFFLAASSLPAQTQPENDRRRLLEQFSESLDELTARVSPAIVQVLVTGYGPVEEKNKGEASQIGKQRSLGSGVILDPDGYIITNAHVVKGAQRVRVLLTPRSASDSQVRAGVVSGEHLPPLAAKIIGVSPSMDLAVLKIEARGLPTLPLADYTKLKKGQLVLAFGNPEGLENTVTMGVVSAIARQPDPDSPSVFIQTDAPINPGNSGGPLVDTQGQLVGINTFILTESGGSQGLGFAIPSSVVQFVYEQLRKFGRVHRSIIGVQLQEITPSLAAGLNLKRQDGVIVSDVLPGTPAEKAGVKIQDILLTIDGRSIASVPIADMIISTKPAGTIVTVEILRGTERLTLDITVTEQKSDVEHLADLVDPEKSLVAKLGMFGIEIDDKLANDLEDLRIPSGVIVAATSADTTGADADLQAGDVIHAVNGKHIETLDGLRAALNALPAGASGVLQIERDGRLMYVTFEMD